MEVHGQNECLRRDNPDYVCGRDRNGPRDVWRGGIPPPSHTWVTMEPFSIITTPEELAALRIDSIICPPRLPASAYRKAWTSFTPNDGRSDLYVTFESTRESDAREAWAILTMHCPADAPEAWVLWDAAATAPEPLKPSSWVTIVPCRRPVKKAHTGLGLAKSAITHQLSGGVATEDMSLQELNPATGKYDVLFNIPKGTLKSQLPW